MNVPRSLLAVSLALLVVVTFGVAALWKSVGEVHRAVLSLQPESLDEPVTLEQPELTRSNVTFEKDLEDGTHITLTCVQQVGETYGDFVARCRKEWKALCEEFED